MLHRRLPWLLALLLLGCQSSGGKLEARDQDTGTKVVVAVETPRPAASPVAPPDTATTDTPMTPAPTSASVRVDADGVEVHGKDGAEVKVDAGGVQVNSGKGARVDIGGDGVKISAPGADIKLQGNLANAEQNGEKLTITGVGDNRTYTCKDQDVEVNGTGHKITLEGTVLELEVNGTSNQVIVKSAQEVELNGTSNVVLYEGKQPKLDLNGIGNRCEPR